MDFNLCGPRSRSLVVAVPGSDVTAAEPKPGWGAFQRHQRGCYGTGLVTVHDSGGVSWAALSATPAKWKNG